MRIIAMTFFFAVLSEMSQVSIINLSAEICRAILPPAKMLQLILIPVGLAHLALFPYDATLLFAGVYFGRLAKTINMR